MTERDTEFRPDVLKTMLDASKQRERTLRGLIRRAMEKLRDPCELNAAAAAVDILKQADNV